MTPPIAPRPKFRSNSRLSHLHRKIASHAHGIFSASVIAASRAGFMKTEASIEGESRLITGAHFQMDEKCTCNPRRAMQPLEQRASNAPPLITGPDRQKTQMRTIVQKFHNREADESAPVLSCDNYAIRIRKTMCNSPFVP